MARGIRAGALAILSPLLGRVLFRLCLGRWPGLEQRATFDAGLLDRTIPLPPCYRAMLAFPEAKPLINQFLLLDRVRAGRLQTANALDAQHATGEPWRVPPLSGNPLAFWRGPPVAFLHLEKTGGGAIAQRLSDACHPEQIDPDPQRTAAAHAITPFAGRDTTEIRRRALVFGHYDLPSLRRLDPARPVITILRDPARRIVSLYHYWRSIRPDLLATTLGNEAVRLAQACEFGAFLRTDDPSVRNYIDNFYARRLTGTYVTASGDDVLAADPDDCLDRALEALRGVEFLGVTEQMTRSLARLDERFGLKSASAAEHHNVAADNARMSPLVFRSLPRDPLTAEHERALAELVRLDRVLYAHACERFEAETSSGNPPDAR